jgi:REP-associated tyrosine transposase
LCTLACKGPTKDFDFNLGGEGKGRTAIQAFQELHYLRIKRYWGNHFLAAGYCVDTGGMDTEMIKKHVKYQDNK